MKKITSLLFACFMCISLVIPCFAVEFTNPPVTDLAEYLTESQINELSEKLEAIRQKYNFEVAIVTEKELSSDDAMSSADDIYDYCGFGAGENDDGIMLYICSSVREFYLTTHADGLRVFNENGIRYLKNNIQPLLAEDDYYGAMHKFADLAGTLLEMAENGEPFNEKQSEPKNMLFIVCCALLIPLIVAWFMMRGKLAKMKTAVSNDYAANYVKPGSMQLSVSRDIFLYSHITKTERPKNDSGTHKSSSGRTHGGGGGSF